MKIRIYNEIQLDGEVEIFNQEYQSDWTQKGDYAYLIYHNEEKEKVLIKYKEDELIMNRFSTPKTLMRFIKGGQAVVVIPTPMGAQHLVTDTSRLEVAEDRIRLDYVLKPMDADAIFASYKMTITLEK